MQGEAYPADVALALSSAPDGTESIARPNPIRRAVARVADVAKEHGNNLGRAAEMSCCGAICPTCAPAVVAVVVIPGLVRRIRGMRTGTDEMSGPTGNHSVS